jgi:hypothetical protein
MRFVHDDVAFRSWPLAESAAIAYSKPASFDYAFLAGDISLEDGGNERSGIDTRYFENGV